MKTLLSAATWIGLLAVVMLSYVACAQQGAMTDAMRQQEAEMNDESAQWNDQLAQWRSQHEEMRAWYAQHDSAAPASARVAMNEQIGRMSTHEQELAEFQTELDTHRATLHQESTRTGGPRAGTHPERWANHVRLKSSFDALSRAHDQLAREHARQVETLEPRAARP